MKFFVTDAQLAAMRLNAINEVQATYASHVTDILERAEAEIARLREDREKELERMVDPQGPFVSDLREQVAFWRLQFRHERQRAEVSIDQCRATHQGIGPVSLPLRDERPQPEMDAALGLFSNNPDLAMMGSPEGV